MQPKKTFATVDYKICNPKECEPQKGICSAAQACTHKVIKQIDGVFEQPMVFQDLCLGCWDCIEACPLKAVSVLNIS